MTRDGQYAIRAEVKASGLRDGLEPPVGYEVPSIWNDEAKEGYCWFALDNMHEISIKPGDFINEETHNDIITSLSGNCSMIYVTPQQ